ncbi:hypothetical protein niasHT_035057 [Heterodera trifolii]|uniref:NR LBD domain-containing protein n=1 Tax=Heterodera trifolii TaxID=157864 RepID=A0ABD2IRE4_9BILA
MKKERVGMMKKTQNNLRKKEKVGSNQIIRCQEVVDFNQINFLLKIEENFSRIRSSPTQLPDAYINQFTSLEHLVNCSENLLATAQKFSTLPPLPWQGERVQELVQKSGFFSAEKPMYRILDHFLSAALFKSIPGMASLCPDDKATLFRSLAMPLCGFISAFFSILLQSDTVIRPNGLMPFWYMNVPRYTFDRNVKVFITNMYCNALKPFKQLQMNREEFVLLLAILITQTSFASNLSRFAHVHLYKECTMYTAILFRLCLRSRHTLEEGLCRFDDLLRLLAHVVWMTDYYGTFAVYMDVFHFRGERKAAMPTSIYPIYSNK